MAYLATAFIAVWLLVTLYVAYMGSQQRRLEDEIRGLEEIVERR